MKRKPIIIANPPFGTGKSWQRENQDTITIKNLLIKFQEWSREKQPLNYNFTDNLVANMFLSEQRIEGESILNLIVCPKCKSKHVKTLTCDTWECLFCNTIIKI